MWVRVSGVIAAGLLTGCATTSQTDGEPVILPGILNLEVAVDSKPTTCPDLSAYGKEFEARGPRACVETAAEDIDGLVTTYSEALRSEGWSMVGGAGPQVWLERPTGSDRCEKVDLTGLPGNLVGLAESRALLMFEHNPDQSCMKSRR